MHRGYIKLHRRIIEWDWYLDHNTTRLFIHLLMKANHKPSKWMGVVVPAGSLITGRKSLAEETGLSEQNIRTSMNRLKSTSELTIKITNKYSMITINNWSDYQQANQQSNQQLTSNQPATNHKQEGEEGKKEKNRDKKLSSSGDEADVYLMSCKKRKLSGESLIRFKAFWSAFNYKHGRAEAIDAWIGLNSDEELAGRITSAARIEAKNRPALIARNSTPKMAPGWLSARRWEDETFSKILDKEKHTKEAKLEKQGRIKLILVPCKDIINGFKRGETTAEELHDKADGILERFDATSHYRQWNDRGEALESLFDWAKKYKKENQ